MSNKKTYLVFTYGTLRKGHANHYLLKGSKFVGQYHTGPGYTKIIKGLPYLLEDAEGEGTYGEVYEVSPLTLKLLDRLEGHPDWYVRTMITVENLEGRVKAYAYLMPEERI